VRSPAGTQRSYLVDTPTGTIRRDCQDLIPVQTPEHDSPPVLEIPEPDLSSQSTDANSQQSRSVCNSPVQTRLRTTIMIKPSASSICEREKWTDFNTCVIVFFI